MQEYSSFGLYSRFCVFIVLGAFLTFLFGSFCFYPSSCYLFNGFLAYIIAFFIIFTDLILRNYRKGATKIRRNVQLLCKAWLHENYDLIRTEYEEKFVAVRKNEIIDSDVNLSHLKKRLNENIGNLKYFYI